MTYHRKSPGTYDYTLIAMNAPPPTPSIPLLRFCDGGLCLRLAVFQSDRPGQGNLDPRAVIRHRDLSGRRAVLPDLLYFRRHLDRSVWIRTRSPRGVGGIRGARLCLPHGGGGGASAAVGIVARRPGGGGSDIRQHAANRRGVDHRISVRNLRQQLRARENENLDAGPLAVDAHRRLDPVRRAGGLGDLLLRRLLRPHAAGRIWWPSCSPNTR